MELIIYTYGDDDLISIHIFNDEPLFIRWSIWNQISTQR